MKNRRKQWTKFAYRHSSRVAMPRSSTLFIGFFGCLLVTGACGKVSLYQESSAEEPSDVNCARVHFPPTDTSLKLQWGTVNLDLPPTERWRSVVEPMKEDIRALNNVILQLLLNITGSQTLIELLDAEMEQLWSTLPEPYKSELQGVSTYTNLSVGVVTMYNVFYDLTSLCTSVIAQDQNGVLYHARNLDFGEYFGWNLERNTWLLPSYLRKVAINVRFVSNANETLYESTQFGGYIGLLTAFKPNAFSLTVNQRDSLQDVAMVIEWLRGNRNLSWNGLLTRRVFDTQTSFDGAKKMLINQPVLSAAYFILGGVAPNEACVITRLIEKAADVWEMTSIADHPWFILQTNYDHWKPQPFYDDRETPGNYCMQQHGQEVAGYAALFDVLSTIPNLNQETVYTALMCTRCGDHLQAYLQYCPKDQRCPL